MIDLATRWLGLELRSPLVVAACPLSRHPGAIAAAVAAGAGAVVMHSLFEEQLIHEQMGAHRFLDTRLDLDAEARSVLPPTSIVSMDVEPYLGELERLRAAVDVPIVASLNGTTPGGWTAYARRLEAAGASALELNLYDVATSPEESGAAVEQRQLDVVRAVVSTVRIPVTVKLSVFYASLPAFVRGLEQAGVRGVALFNRFLQPDIDLDALDVDRTLTLSTPAELPLRLHGLALVSATASPRLSLACTGGVHSGRDAAKAILCGAHVVQLASALLARGPAHLAVVRDELAAWLAAAGYEASAEARGVLNLHSAPDPHAWERLNYARMLEGYTPRARGQQAP
jgi:dihydroorotate dehydrogenase (fumarate)